MGQYFVIGGIFQDITGHEAFALVCPGTGEPPYVMVEGVMDYFRLVWQNAHLYRVEKDYSLVLVAPSPEALERGVKAPERVWPDADLLKKLRAVIKQDTSPDTPEENGQDGCLRLTEPIST
jgi:hypothetical protein